VLPPKFRVSGMSIAIASMEWIFPALRGRPPLSGGCLVAASRWGDRPPTHTVAPDQRGVQIAAARAGSGDRAAAGRGRGAHDLNRPLALGFHAACFCHGSFREASCRESRDIAAENVAVTKHWFESHWATKLFWLVFSCSGLRNVFKLAAHPRR
jgi:hypothetical protein